MKDPFNLKRFVSAQDQVIEQVYRELEQGRKSGHWMWFIFPQIEGLGQSQMSRAFGISSLEEAKAYLTHSVLGSRLRRCTELVCKQERQSAREIFGYPDDLKFRSSMTLFAQASPRSKVFKTALERFYHGEPDRLTLAKLR